MEQTVVDADFYIKLTKNELSTRLFEKILQGMEMDPVMHKYVYSVELKGDPYIGGLHRKNALLVLDYSDYLLTEDEREEYRKYFLDAYEYMMGEEFDEGNDIYTYDEKHEHLGEIRSVYLAMKKEIPYFSSDDKDAGKLAERYVSNSAHRVEVLTVEKALRVFTDNGHVVKWSELKNCIPKAYKDDENAIERIKEIIK